MPEATGTAFFRISFGSFANAQEAVNNKIKTSILISIPPFVDSGK